MLHSLYISKDGVSVFDSIDTWGLVLKSAPLMLGGKVKSPSKRSWYDEDGDEEYVPSVQKLESFDVKYELGYKGSAGSANAVYSSLTEFLTGADGTGSVFSAYDDWSKCGWERCRFSELSIDSKSYRSWNEDNGGYEDIVIGVLSLRVLSPRDLWSPDV